MTEVIFLNRHGFCSRGFTAGGMTESDRSKLKNEQTQESISLGFLNRRKKEKEGSTIMKTMANDLEKPSYWQLVFLQSKVNGAQYDGEELPGRNWNWPKDTYLQRRLQQFNRWLQPADHFQLN